VWAIYPVLKPGSTWFWKPSHDRGPLNHKLLLSSNILLSVSAIVAYIYCYNALHYLRTIADSVKRYELLKYYCMAWPKTCSSLPSSTDENWPWYGFSRNLARTLNDIGYSTTSTSTTRVSDSSAKWVKSWGTEWDERWILIGLGTYSPSTVAR
jgi:hypothetical protein